MRCRRRSSNAPTRGCCTWRPTRGRKSLTTQNVAGSRAGTPAARRRCPASTSRTTSRSAPATSCRSAAAGDFCGTRNARGRGVARRVAGRRASTSGAAAGRSRRRSRAIARTPASAASGPNRIASGKLDNPTVEGWFDETAFVLPAQFTYGNSGGNILREDSYKTLDFSLFKQFRIGDAPVAVPGRSLQPDEHAELQRAEHGDRHGGRRRVTSTSSSAAADAVRVEVPVLSRCRTRSRAPRGL